MARTEQWVEVHGHHLTLSNLEKLYWPEDGLCKGDLVAYYTQLATVLLPYLRDRPLVLTRYPNGIHGQWFYHKNLETTAPDWLRTCAIAHEAGTYQYLLADSPAALAFAANLGAIEIHPWLSRCGRLAYPDFAVIDIDPAGDATWQDVREVALLVRQILQEVGVTGWPKTSGATGLHIYCPCLPDHTYADTAAFAEAIGRLLARLYPERVTVERMVRKRGNKIYIDYLQNRQGQTITSVYGLRPRPGAPVSTPITWAELAADQVPAVTLRTLGQRLAQVGDLFAPVLQHRQDLRPATQWLRAADPGNAPGHVGSEQL